MRAGFDFGLEACDFRVEVIGNGVERDADGEICGSAERLAGPSQCPG